MLISLILVFCLNGVCPPQSNTTRARIDGPTLNWRLPHRHSCER